MYNEQEKINIEKQIKNVEKTAKKIEKFHSKADYFLHSSAYLNPFVIVSRGIGCIMIGPALLLKKINSNRKLKLKRKYNEIIIADAQKRSIR